MTTTKKPSATVSRNETPAGRQTLLLTRESGGRIPHREFTRNVPKHFDGGDIDKNGRWLGEHMSCLECRETAAMRMGITSTHTLKQLECGECGEPFAEVWI